MKKLKRFLRKYRDRIISVSTLALFGVILALTIVYLLSETMNPAIIFLAGAALMLVLIMNYSKQKVVGVYVFYGITTIACLGICFFLLFNPLA